MPSSLTRKQTKTSWLLSMIKITLEKIQTTRRLWRGSYSLLAVCPYKAIISFKCRINPFCGSSGWFRDAFGWNRPHLRVHQGLGIVKERWAIVYVLMLARQKELCNRCFFPCCGIGLLRLFLSDIWSDNNTCYLYLITNLYRVSVKMGVRWINFLLYSYKAHFDTLL